MHNPFVPDRTATTLVRLARDPRSGRLRRGSALDIGLRGALFVDLVFAGHLVSDGRAPVAATTEPTGDRFLDILRDAVAARPGVAWPRWYRHVRTDRRAIVGELVADGRWRQESGRRRPQYRDGDPAGIAELGRRLRAVGGNRVEPRDDTEAALAALCVICGALDRPDPGAVRKELRPLIDTIALSDDEVRVAVRSALGGASLALRGARRGRGVS